MPPPRPRIPPRPLPLLLLLPAESFGLAALATAGSDFQPVRSALGLAERSVAKIITACAKLWDHLGFHACT
eukprot:6202474-Pleurochrysis_carterae.AAC.1